MSAVYEVLKDGKRLQGDSLFAHERMARKLADEMNRNVIKKTMKEANQLSGAIRGKNKNTLEEMIDRVAKPPYTVVRLNVNNQWG
jgi:hypothetical protein